MIRLNEMNRMAYQEQLLHLFETGDEATWKEGFLALHPSDQIDVYLLLNRTQQQRLHEVLSSKQFAILFAGLHFSQQQAVVKDWSPQQLAAILQVVYTDEAVRYLQQLDRQEAEELLGYMVAERAEQIRAILWYEAETAGALLSHAFLQLNPEQTVAEVLNQVKRDGEDAELVYYLYVVDKQRRLIGVVTLKRLLLAQPEQLIREIMQTQVVSVPTDLHHAEIGVVFQKYDLIALPVVDEQQQLVGMLTVDDVMDVVERQTSKRFSEFSAMKEATEENETSIQAAKKRVPWIVFLMFAGMLTSRVIHQFESVLESVVLLAAFMPLLMDAGGNVGTQSLALSVRNLATKRSMGTLGQQVKKELLTGFWIGCVCFFFIVLLILIFYQALGIGLVVGISLVVTLTFSAAIGLIFPILLNKLSIDPAVASGPFITTINDVVGLFVYFTVATTLMAYL